MTDDGDLKRILDTASAGWPADEETAAACAERCLEALSHIDRNANQSAWIEAWLDDLARITGGAGVSVAHAAR